MLEYTTNLNFKGTDIKQKNRRRIIGFFVLTVFIYLNDFAKYLDIIFPAFA